MPALLVSHRFHAEYGAELSAHAAKNALALELVVLPADAEGRLPEPDCGRIAAAFFSEDVFPTFSRQFFSAVRKAPALDWLQVFNAGVDHPIYTEMLARGVRVTTSSGATAEPIAQTAIAGLLMLARNFPHWLAAQRRHSWEPARDPHVPRDLKGSVMLILGLGHIGAEIARLARALGLHVIGARRSPRRPEDPVDEMVTPDALAAVLPRADWLVIACPLTPETRGLVNRDLLARLPEGARVINVGRGEIVDEAALIAALQSGKLGGAYLDVFAQEPLPAESPLWDIPNVLVSPHNAAAAHGNERRVYAIFLDNLARWMRREPLRNEVRSAARAA
jgi:phosphoglycerate dehydrogenase-like enzyme